VSLVTIPAVNGAIFSWPEWDLGRLSAIGTDDVVHLTGRTIPAIPAGGVGAEMASAAAATGSFTRCAATGTAFGLGETTFCKERLLPSGKNKGAAAIGTIQRAILEL
jgi:hypothetical protein